LDKRGTRDRRVIVVGDAVTDDDGRIVATRGVYIDITESSDDELQQSVDRRMDVDHDLITLHLDDWRT